MALSPTPADIRYMEEHINDSKVGDIIAVNVTGLCIAIFAVFLRFLSRRLVRTEIKADDFMIVVALVLFSGYAISWCVATKYGAGRHAIVVTDPKALTETLIIVEAFYVLTLAAIKVSILLLYHRIFPQKWFRLVLIIVGCIIIVWGLVGLLVQIFQCWPIKTQWDPSVAGHCINYPAYALTLVITNVVTDLVILALPIPLVWRLHTTLKKKLMLIATFAIGCGACIVSIVRLIYVHDLTISYDSSWTFTRSGEIASSEVIVGIVAACFPTYRSIYKFCTKRFKNRAAKMSHSSNIDSPGAGLGEVQLQTIKTMERSVSGRGKLWMPLEDDKENLMNTNNRERLEYSEAA